MPRLQLATAERIADVLDESTDTVRRHTRRGDYAAFAVNIGTEQRPRWRYDLARLERWLEAKRTAA